MAEENEGGGPGTAGSQTSVSNTTTNNNTDCIYPSRVSLLDQKPSFDPCRDPAESCSTVIIESTMEPTAVTASAPMAIAAQQGCHDRLLFRPERESRMAATMRSGGQVAAVGGRRGFAAESAGNRFFGGSTGAGGAARCVSRETS